MLAGIAWRNKGLLETALTHRSHAVSHYERLEFLGDRVLNLIVAEWLVEYFPAADEGELSRRHTAMVKESHLVEIAYAWALPEHVRLGAGEVVKPSILADVVEAVLGALWLDSGLEAVREVVRRDWKNMLESEDVKDAKSRLQEQLQAEKGGLPRYEVLSEQGPDHAKVFEVKVSCGWGEAVGEGASKQAASLMAAENLLMKIGK
jgi:ribonuclease-3